MTLQYSTIEGRWYRFSSTWGGILSSDDAAVMNLPQDSADNIKDTESSALLNKGIKMHFPSPCFTLDLSKITSKIVQNAGDSRPSNVKDSLVFLWSALNHPKSSFTFKPCMYIVSFVVKPKSGGQLEGHVA